MRSNNFEAEQNQQSSGSKNSNSKDSSGKEHDIPAEKPSSRELHTARTFETTKKPTTSGKVTFKVTESQRFGKIPVKDEKETSSSFEEEDDSIMMEEDLLVSPVAHHNKARMYQPGQLNFKKLDQQTMPPPSSVIFKPAAKKMFSTTIIEEDAISEEADSTHFLPTTKSLQE